MFHKKSLKFRNSTYCINIRFWRYVWRIHWVHKWSEYGSILKKREMEWNGPIFGKLVPKILDFAKMYHHTFFFTLFPWTYLCQSLYWKMKYAKNLYRNQLSDSHFDNVLRIICNNHKPDSSKIVQCLCQRKKSHYFLFNNS